MYRDQASKGLSTEYGTLYRPLVMNSGIGGSVVRRQTGIAVIIQGGLQGMPATSGGFRVSMEKPVLVDLGSGIVCDH